MTNTLSSSLDTEPQALDPELLHGLDQLLDEPYELDLAVRGVELVPLVHGATTVRPVAYEGPNPDPEMPGLFRIISIVETENDRYVGGGKVAVFLPEGHDGSVSEQTRPYVGWTETVEEYKGQGRGTQRYEDLNSLAVQYFGQVLHSNPLDDISDSARGVWNKLVDNGRAEQYLSDHGLRYRFKTGA